jgi:hypothetical protein
MDELGSQTENSRECKYIEYSPNIYKDFMDDIDSDEPIEYSEKPTDVETPVVESPIVDTHIVESPIVDTHIVETPVVETPVVETHVVDTHIVETPVVETPIVDTHIVETPIVETPVVDTVNKIPKLVFIIPYRDREQQYIFYNRHMKLVLEDYSQEDYKMLYIHQNDKRDFNRGAIKNIGFLVVKHMYPDNYKQITLVFNDIDIMPLNKNLLNYETTRGVIKHFYGYKHTLGGIVSITGYDFEKINGFPNFWAWGFEDNLFQYRAISSKLIIDRSNFFPIYDKNFILLHDGLTRIINKNEFSRYIRETKEGIHSIQNISFKINESTGFVDVNNFTTDVSPISSENREFDLRNGSRPFNPPVKPTRRGTMKMQF